MWALFGVHSYYKGLSMYILKYRSMGYRVKLPCSVLLLIFFFSSRRRHTRFKCDWSSDVCSSDLSSRGGTTCSLGDPLLRNRTGSPRLHVVPPRDDRTELGPGDLGHDPRVDLGRAVVGWGHDPEFREQPASLGFVILEKDLVRNQPTVLLDGLHGRGADVPDPAWERLGNSLLDQTDGVQGTIGYAGQLDSLHHRRSRQPEADGADPLRAVGRYRLDVKRR